MKSLTTILGAALLLITAAGCRGGNADESADDSFPPYSSEDQVQQPTQDQLDQMQQQGQYQGQQGQNQPQQLQKQTRYRSNY